MKRWVMLVAVSSATALMASAQSIIVRPYVWHDDASSDFSASFANGCLTLSDTSTWHLCTFTAQNWPIEAVINNRR